MKDQEWLKRHSRRTLERMLPRLEAKFKSRIKAQHEHWDTYLSRLEAHFEDLFRLYHSLYGTRYDFFYYLEQLLSATLDHWFARQDGLKQLDRQREIEPDWYHSEQMLAGVIYVDLFAGDLAGVRKKIPYFQELGLTYLHLMPLFLAPEGENDGGYAVSSYREVDPKLGSMQDLSDLARDLRAAGISLVVDLVFNHTSDEHIWAKRALAGDPDYQDYYRIFPDRKMPDAYEATMREIFPDEHPGAFTYRPEIGAWVWTTFHSYQWDLNYANPEVFNKMAEEMLFLANVGVEILRLDAVAFIWKRLGTSSENLPEAHTLIRAFNTVARIAAPALLFKSEAIVHPDDVASYIDPRECQLSYNPLVMALSWNSLATRQVNMLKLALEERFQIDPQCAWVNYVRCHDDIGWTFSDDDAARLGINGYDHRRFLNAFYTGRFEGSFARGLPFQENPRTGDARISGMCASLAGLEMAVQSEDAEEIELSIKRILVLHGVALTVGGIPLLYLNDEIGTLNDYSYREDPELAGDSRWVHRVRTDWDKMARRSQAGTLEARVFDGFMELIKLRKSNPAFGGQQMQVVETGNDHVLAFLRLNGPERALVLVNFSEHEQVVSSNVLRLALLSYEYQNLLDGTQHGVYDFALQAYDFVCLAPVE